MGKCACTEGWEGNACECPKSQQTCLDSKGVSRSRNWAQAGLDGPSRCLSGCGGLCLHRVSAMAEENVCVAFASVQTLVSKWPQPVSQISRCVCMCVCEVVLQTVGVSRSYLTCHVCTLVLGSAGCMWGNKKLCPVPGLEDWREERQKRLWHVSLHGRHGGWT